MLIQLIIYNVIVICLIDLSIIYSLSSGIPLEYIYIYIRTWISNTDTHVIYGIKRLIKNY